MLGSVVWGSAGVVPPVATFLPLEAAVEVAVCEDAFLGETIAVGEAISGGVLGECLVKGEGTLSVYARALNESINVVGIFIHI